MIQIPRYANTDFAVAGGTNPNGINWIGKESKTTSGIVLDIEKTSQPLRPWGLELGLTVLELASSQAVGRSIDIQNHAAMRMKWKRVVDQCVYVSDSSTGFGGMLNLTGVTPLASAAWVMTTVPDVILGDFDPGLGVAWLCSG